MIQFKKYRVVPGGFEDSDKQGVEEPTEFTTTQVEVDGFYWMSGPLNPLEFRLQHHDTGSTRFGFRSVSVIPRPPTQIEILTELQKLVKHPILCGGGDHESVALVIDRHNVPEKLMSFLFYDSAMDTVYLPL